MDSCNMWPLCWNRDWNLFTRITFYGSLRIYFFFVVVGFEPESERGVMMDLLTPSTSTHSFKFDLSNPFSSSSSSSSTGTTVHLSFFWSCCCLFVCCCLLDIYEKSRSMCELGELPPFRNGPFFLGWGRLEKRGHNRDLVCMQMLNSIFCLVDFPEHGCCCCCCSWKKIVSTVSL